MVCVTSTCEAWQHLTLNKLLIQEIDHNFWARSERCGTLQQSGANGASVSDNLESDGEEIIIGMNGIFFPLSLSHQCHTVDFTPFCSGNDTLFSVRAASSRPEWAMLVFNEIYFKKKAHKNSNSSSHRSWVGSKKKKKTPAVKEFVHRWRWGGWGIRFKVCAWTIRVCTLFSQS